MGNPYAPPGEGSRGQRPPDPDVRDPGVGGAGPGAPPPPAGELGAPRPGGAGPVAGPGQGPGRQQPTPEVARATSRRVLHFLALLLAAVVTSAFPLPWQVGSILFVIAAIVVGVRAFVLAWRSGVRGGLALMLGIGVGVAGFVALGMLSLLALWPQQVERQECLARAVTISATRACEVEFERAVDERLSGTARPDAA